MIHEAIATGATIEEARKNAEIQLGAPADAEVHTEIISVPQKKILGLFGGAPAKARAWYETPDAPVKAKTAEKQDTDKKAAPAAEKPKKAPVKAETEPVAEVAPIQEEKPEVTKTPINPAESESISAAVEYLSKILTGMGIAEFSTEVFRTSEDEIIIELDCGEEYGVVIGRRGDTLDSIQYLTRLVANKKKLDSEYLRISINVGNYREKRKQTLRELAKKNSEKVLKYGRNVTFEPMNPYERRIIHTAVQEIEGVTSYSVGADANRRVVITLQEGVKPTHARGNRRGGGKGGYKGGKPRNGARSGKAPAQTAPTREPRTDAGAEKVSLYGKIN